MGWERERERKTSPPPHSLLSLVLSTFRAKSVARNVCVIPQSAYFFIGEHFGGTIHRERERNFSKQKGTPPPLPLFFLHRTKKKL